MLPSAAPRCGQAILVDHDDAVIGVAVPVSNEREATSEFSFSDGMSVILSELRHHYEMIIIDAPPVDVLRSTDAHSVNRLTE